MKNLYIEGAGIIDRSLMGKVPEARKMLRYLPNYCYFTPTKPSTVRHPILPMIDYAVQEGKNIQATVRRTQPKAVNLYKAKIAPDYIIEKAERIVLDFNPGIECNAPEFESLVENEVRLLMTAAK